MELPGFGSDTDKCREPSGWISCADGCTKTPLRDSCQRVECPHCWGDWAGKAARRVSDRLRGVRSFIYHERPGDYHQVKRIRHIVFSPPHGMLKEDDGLDAAKRVWRRLERSMHLLYMGTVFYHPYRIRDDVEERLKCYMRERGLADDPGDYQDGGYWALVRADVLGLGCRDAYIEFSPHYHVLGSGGLMPSDKFFEKTHGWVYVMLGARHMRIRINPKTGAIVDEVAITAKYILSHAGVEKSKETGRYRNSYWQMGYTAQGRLVRNERGTPVVRLHLTSVLVCPVCGEELHRCHIDYAGEPVMDTNAIFCDRKYRKYEVVEDV